MRSRPSLSLVVAVLALVFSLAGAAEASLLITKNDQVGPHTIAGANAPKGDNHNLIAGSVGTADLHAGAVTAAKVAANAVTGSRIANGTITGSDLNLASVADGVKVRNAFGGAAPGIDDAFFHVAPWTLTGHCLNDGASNYHMVIDLAFTGPAAILAVGDGAGIRYTSGPLQLVATASSTTTSSQAADFSVILPGFSNQLEGRVFGAVDIQDYSGPECVFTFGGLGS